MVKAVARFWREIPQRYNLIGRKCMVCNRVFFPQREVCPFCRRNSLGKMVDVKLSGKGRVVTFTVIHAPPSKFEDQTPYAIAIVEFDEGPRVTGQIVDRDLDKIEIGMPVQATFRRIQDDGYTGAIYYGYKFRPLEEYENKG
ncbi:MAG TPA: Zn-ribbon domain-containing OB-fold protein [Thermoplasmatales archaeon]|nr:Zn-ribbon domain-containing OB-fold protein [Thermoplasmatales archaeon]